MPFREFNLEQAAEYLHLQPADLDEMARQGLVPCRQVGGRFLFRKSEIERWISQRVLGLKTKGLKDYHKRASVKAHDVSKTHAFLSELVKPEYIEPRLTSRTRHSVIRDMVELANRTGLLNDAEGLRQSIETREKFATTALEGGVAMLHAEYQQPYMFEDSFVVLGRTVQAVPFGAPDGRTTDLFFLICCQDDRIHLPVLARLCMICHQTSLLLDLREAGSAAEMYNTLLRSEQEVIARL